MLLILVSAPLAFIVSLVGLFREAQKGWAIAGLISSVVFGLTFVGLPWLVNCLL